MTKQEIIEAVQPLHLPKHSYVVFGSGPLAAAGIREANDIDLFVSEAVLQQFIQEGWQQVKKGPLDEPYTSGVFEAHANWNFSPYAPTLAFLLASADTYDGVPFASLREIQK
jgi:hypothetical protein